MMRIRFRIQLINYDADPDTDYQNDADPCGSGSTTLVIRYNLTKLQYITVPVASFVHSLLKAVRPDRNP
jgi:hypothetical protein